jgi:hypothetical protein
MQCVIVPRRDVEASVDGVRRLLAPMLARSMARQGALPGGLPQDGGREGDDRTERSSATSGVAASGKGGG